MKNILLLILFLSSLFAVIHRVPHDRTTIQEGVDAASTGDTVLVDEGIYYENVRINKEITVASYFIVDGDLSHRDSTIIDGSNYNEDYGPFGSCVLFRPSDTGDAISAKFTGFTIQNGMGTRVRETISDTTINYYIGGGFMIDHCLPEITYNYIRDNGEVETAARGGGPGRGGGGGFNNSEDVEFDEDRNDPYLRPTLTRNDEIILSDNIFQNNYAIMGKTFQSIDFQGTVKLTNSTFDVYSSEFGMVTTYWVEGHDAEIDFSNGEGFFETITVDVYIDPVDGDDNNEGIMDSNPFKTIDYALSRVYGVLENPITIFLSNGLYSPSANEETFPINLLDYISLEGANQDSTEINSESGQSAYFSVIELHNVTSIYIKNIAISGAQGGGGGVYCNNSTLTLENVSIYNNWGWNGGGISIRDGSNVDIISSYIGYNLSVRDGGGINAYGANLLRIIDTQIEYNQSYSGAGGINVSYSTNFEIIGSIINNNSIIGALMGAINTAPGIDLNNNFGKTLIKNCTIWGNYVDEDLVNWCPDCYQSVIEIYLADVDILNSIIFSNTPPLIMTDDSARLYIQYSNIEQNFSGTGNISSDPLFLDPLNGNFHLQDNSPSLDAGNPIVIDKDENGTRNDMGAFGGTFLNLAPDEVNFGEVSFGSTIYKQISLSNYRNSPVFIDYADFDDYLTGIFSFENLQMPIQINKMSEESFLISFSPSEDDDIVNDTTSFFISILTDNYPEETSWSLVDGTGYGWWITAGDLAGSPNTLFGWEIDLLPGTYTWTIFDVFGDGICCSWGEGYYELYLNGEMFASGGEFGDSESVDFTIGGDAEYTDSGYLQIGESNRVTVTTSYFSESHGYEKGELPINTAGIPHTKTERLMFIEEEKYSGSINLDNNNTSNIHSNTNIGIRDAVYSGNLVLQSDEIANGEDINIPVSGIGVENDYNYLNSILFGNLSVSNSPYLVNGDLTIPQDSILYIDPGVQLLFTGPYKMVVNGTLNSIGTASDSIYFNNIDPSVSIENRWEGIDFINSNGSNLIEYTKISNAYKDLGGGIRVVTSNLDLNNVVIENCIAETNGGGIANENSSVNIDNSIIRYNTSAWSISDSSTGWWFSEGGGVSSFGEYATLAINDSKIYGNHSSIGGSGIVNALGSILYMKNVDIYNNGLSNGLPQSNRGGGIYLYVSTATLENVIFHDNFADVGGGIYVECADLNLFNSVIWNNSSIYAGGINITEFTPLGENVCDNAVNIVNTIVRNNTNEEVLVQPGTFDPYDSFLMNISHSNIEGGEENGILLDDMYSCAGMDCYYPTDFCFCDASCLNYNDCCPDYEELCSDDLGNLINQNELKVFSRNEIDTGSLLDRNISRDHEPLREVIVNWLDGNIDSDPLFTDPFNGDFNLISGSPCIDAGTDLFVIDDEVIYEISESEYNGTAPDIGAIESEETGGGDMTITFQNLQGWNMVGLPLLVDNPFYLDIYPDAQNNTLYAFNGLYQSVTDLVPGAGYLLRFLTEGENTITGTPFYEVTVTLNEGWNIISGVSETVSADQIYSSGLINNGTLYGYNGIYYSSDVLEPGSGYWARSSTGGELTITSNGLTVKSLDDWKSPLLEANKIEIGSGQFSSDLYFGIEIGEENSLSYSLPPIFEGINFDARFSGDTKVVLESGEIEVLSNSETLTIEYDIKVDAGEHYNWVLTSGTGKDYILEGTGEITVPSAERFVLNRGSVIPITFALHQNFPNPFNPITTLRYDLPSESFVTLTVFDMLGREITQLVNTTQEAGFKLIHWNSTDSMGKPVSAGVYLYQIQAGEFVQTKKMVLLK